MWLKLLMLLPLFLRAPESEVPLHAWALSGDGKVVVGSAKGRPALWSRAKGLRFMPSSTFGAGAVLSASRDGSVLAGYLFTPGAGAGQVNYVCVWNHGSLTVIGADESHHFPFVSSDGTTVVGNVGFGFLDGGMYPDRYGDGAFRWRRSTGLVMLEPLCPGLRARMACSCSANGDVVVGYSQTKPPRISVPKFLGNGQPPFLYDWQACKWDSGGHARLLAPPKGFICAVASRCTSDGSVIVGDGQSEDAGGVPGQREVLMWTERSTWEPKVLPSRFSCFDSYVSSSGLRIAATGNPLPYASRGCVLWKNLQSDPTQIEVGAKTGSVLRGISADGRTVLCQGEGDHSWLVEIPGS